MFYRLVHNVRVYSVLGFRSCVLSHDTERNMKDKTKISDFPQALNKHIVGNSWVSSVNNSTSLSSSAVNYIKFEFLSLVKKPNSVNILNLMFFSFSVQLSACGRLLQRGKILRVGNSSRQLCRT